MKERQAVVAAWNEARRSGEEAVLATVVRIQGSTYRRPGARLLVLGDGRRIGSVSGGCLEDEVARKAWWLTEGGPAVQRYSTLEDDDGARRFGSGCEGVVHILLERLRPEAGDVPQLRLLDACHRQRRAGALVTVIDAGDTRARAGDRVLAGPDGEVERRCADEAVADAMAAAAASALASGRSGEQTLDGVQVFVEHVAPPRSLVVFGAGFDAIPVVRMAVELGWHVTVADGRAHHARRDRFPLADEVAVIDAARPLERLAVPDGAACLLMTHSADQDRALLTALAPLPVAYLGVLGPRRRTEQLLRELPDLRFACTSGLHSPVGLDIGGETPEEIALAALAEIQASFARRDGRRLRDRADGLIHTDSA